MTGAANPRSSSRSSSATTSSWISPSAPPPAETSPAAVTQIEFADQLTVAATTAVPKADRSLWWVLACAGFVVLLVEWWWFQQRPGVA